MRLALLASLLVLVGSSACASRSSSSQPRVSAASQYTTDGQLPLTPEQQRRARQKEERKRLIEAIHTTQVFVI